MLPAIGTLPRMPGQPPASGTLAERSRFMQDPRSSRPAAARLELRFMSTAQKVSLVGGPVLLAVFSAFAAGMVMAGMLISDATGSRIPVGYVLGVVAWVLVILVLCVLNLVIQFRAGAWLEGTTLVVRGLWTRQADLAAVPVSLRRIRGWPCLIARDNVTGREARLVLRRLAAPELAALAGAIMAGGRQDPGAWQVAEDLRRQAAGRQWADEQRRAALSGMSGPPAYPGYRGSGG
jgi:hypothetical protein